MADAATDTGSADQTEQSEQTQPNGHSTPPQQTLRVRSERGQEGRDREREKQRVGCGSGGREGRGDIEREREKREMILANTFFIYSRIILRQT